MNTLIHSFLVRVLALALLTSLLLSACAGASIPVADSSAVSASPTSIPPTAVPATAIPTDTATAIPTVSPTPAPADPPVRWTDGKYATFVDMATDDALATYGYSTWAGLVDGLVMKNPRFSYDYQHSFTIPELPYNSATAQAYVLNVVRLPELRQRWLDQGVTDLYVLVVALPASHEAGLVLCGLVQNGAYRKICPAFEAPYWISTEEDTLFHTPDDLLSLKDQFIAMRFIDYTSGRNQDQMKLDKWAALADPENANHTQTANNYLNQIVRRGDDLPIYQQIILDKDGPIWKLLDVRLFEKDAIPAELYVPKHMAAFQVWAFDHAQIEGPFIIPELLGDAGNEL